MAEQQLGTVPVGQPDNGSLFSGQRGRLLLLGGAGVAVAAVILLSRRGSAPPAGETSVAPGTLTPDAAIALGSLEARSREQAGRLEQLFMGFGGDILDRIGSTEDALLGELDASTRQLLANADDNTFWLTAQRRGELMNVRASVEKWTPLQWAQNARIYAADMASIRPDLTDYFRQRWEDQFGDSYDWETVVSQTPGGS